MKRYDIGMATSFGVATRKMREYDTGTYVRFEDVVEIVDLLLNECGQDEITAEEFILDF